MSSNVIEPVLFAAKPQTSRAAANAARVKVSLPAVAVLAPALAALAALLVHHLVPIQQNQLPNWMDKLPAWQHPFPVLLDTVLVLSLLLAGWQCAWTRLRPWVRYYAPLVAGAVGVLSILELITAKLAWFPHPYFPGPDDILGAMVEDRGLLLQSTANSLLLLLIGYGVGVMGGLTAGVLIGWFKPVRYWGMPLVKLLGPIPATALMALAMMLFPKSFFSAVFLISYAVWFPVTTLTASGIANVRVSYLDVARTLGAGRLYLIFRVALPSALPNIFLGLFIGLLASNLTLVVAEGMGVESGLGWYIMWQKGYADFAKVYASLVILSLFSSTTMTLLFIARDRMLKWQKGVLRW